MCIKIFFIFFFQFNLIKNDGKAIIENKLDLNLSQNTLKGDFFSYRSFLIPKFIIPSTHLLWNRARSGRCFNKKIVKKMFKISQKILWFCFGTNLNYENEFMFHKNLTFVKQYIFII